MCCGSGCAASDAGSRDLLRGTSLICFLIKHVFLNHTAERPVRAESVLSWSGDEIKLCSPLPTYLPPHRFFNCIRTNEYLVMRDRQIAM
jgi:hypothetical protein